MGAGKKQALWVTWAWTVEPGGCVPFPAGELGKKACKSVENEQSQEKAHADHGPEPNWEIPNKTIMKTIIIKTLRGSSLAIILVLLLILLTSLAQGQIFVVNNPATIGEYNFDGTPINATLVSGLVNA